MLRLISLFVVAASCNASIVSSASVTTGSFYSLGVTGCTMHSTGQEIMCRNQFAEAIASAGGGVFDGQWNLWGAASIGTAVAQVAAVANASSIFNSSIVLGNFNGNTITGHYFIELVAGGDYPNNDYGGAQFIQIGQGGITITNPPRNMFSPYDILVQSTAQVGVPFSVSDIVQSFAYSPGSENSAADLFFSGFTDTKGDEVPFQIVDQPEPATWALVLSGILLLSFASVLSRSQSRLNSCG